MKVIETGIPGLKVFEPRVFEDQRGFFMETYNKEIMAGLGLDFDFVQDNHAKSEQTGVLRGLHFQLPPKAQTKLVRVTAGSVFDVAVDLRQGSPTFGKWYGVELSAANFRQLLVPKGFAHSYVTLEPETEFVYKVDEFYAPECDSGIRWDDPDLGITWPIKEPLLSDKDLQLQALKEFETPFVFEN